MKKRIIAAVLVAFACMSAKAQQPQLLPVDPEVRVGTLENGLTYYIRHNETPKERCEFHIAQAVGATLERDDQNGLAHFLEHMAFNGTEHFPGKGIINYFESVGVSFGGHINAYTAHDQTVYRLSGVPTRESVLDSALLVLRDWSCGLLLQGDEIDAERGVIREEWRTRRNASSRMRTELSRQMYPGTPYATRDVIGDTAVINNFTYDALKDYYHTWYGPDLQAIIVVGDIDVDKMEQKIINLFAPIKERANRGVRPTFSLGTNEEPIVAIVKDSEAQRTYEYLIIKDPNSISKEMRQTNLGYFRALMDNLASIIMGYRFDEMRISPDANFVQASGYYTKIAGETDGYRFVVIPRDGKEKEAFADVCRELEKVRRYGFTQSEFERAKTQILAVYERLYNERDNNNSQQLAEECINNFILGESMPGMEYEFALAKQILGHTTVQVLNEIVRDRMNLENVILAYSGKDVATAPEREDLLAAFNAMSTHAVERPVEEEFDAVLVDNEPTPGSIRKEKYNKDLGTTEWTLSNGVKVIIKPTTFRSDEIIVTATSYGGLAYVKDEDLISAQMASNIVNFNGLGKFSKSQLQRALTGKNLSLNFSINQYSESISGFSTVKDFETLLQLHYLHFTQLRSDDAAFATLCSNLRTQLSSRRANPKSAFQDTIQAIMSNYSARTALLNDYDNFVDRLDQQRALQIYRERFSNPADFRYVFIGNIDPNDEATRALICKWLGGMPATSKREKLRDDKERVAPGVVKNYFRKEMQVKTATNYIVYSGKEKATLENRLVYTIIGRILSTRYLESIREREGGSYGVSCAGLLHNVPVNQALLMMQFDTDPDKQERLIEIIHQEVQAIITDGPRADDLQKVKETILKELDESLEKNGYWNRIITDYYDNHENIPRDTRAIVNGIDAAKVQKVLAHLVKQGNLIEVVLLPE